MSTLKDIGSALAQVAPTIAGLFLGPLGATGVQAAEQALGIAPTAGTSTDDRKSAVLSALSGATPEQLVALKQADNALKQKLIDGGVQLEQISASNQQSARDMQTKAQSSVPAWLTILIVFGFIAAAYFVISDNAPGFKNPNVSAMAGAVVLQLIHEVRAILRFWLGNDGESGDSSSMIAAAIDKGKP